MKRGAVVVLLLCVAGVASAEQVSGYTRSDGTYVQGYQRSSGDSYRYNNYGSQTNGGDQRDEYSSGYGATNRSNSGWGSRDNDNDGYQNAYDESPGR